MVSRWITYLSTFNFDIVHRKGASHGNAKGLSQKVHWRRRCECDSCPECSGGIPCSDGSVDASGPCGQGDHQFGAGQSQETPEWGSDGTGPPVCTLTGVGLGNCHGRDPGSAGQVETDEVMVRAMETAGATDQ